MSVASPRKSARERLLAAADELFYAEGVHTVGIDRVIERAGVAKASLYSTFGSKDELVRAYLRGRHESRRTRILAGIERFATPRERLLGVFDLLAESAAKPGFRGCAFYNAGAERDPSGAVRDEADNNRAWTRGLFADLASAIGVPDPEALADQLVVLYDGALVGARLKPGPQAPAAARAVAATLLDSLTR
ncbi:TetR/AcrR family transcriptional regulator [Actinoplanes sp. GCM10030250]|uniref:TetR/AcrR family transcriptional regulator n=1 Tax=Actinoplanes sp. GCM10030250 TaxID=3273376 RepID=UPI0036180298